MCKPQYFEVFCYYGFEITSSNDVNDLMQLFSQHGKPEDVADLKTCFPDGELKFDEGDGKEVYEDTVDWIARKMGFQSNLITSHDYKHFVFGVITHTYSLKDIVKQYICGVNPHSAALEVVDPTEEDKKKLFDFLGNRFHLYPFFVPNDCICCS